MRRARSTIVSGFMILCIGIAGCSSKPNLVEVKGKVTLNGKGIGNVKVEFQPDPDQGTRGSGSAGTTDDEGNFRLNYIDGTPGAIVGHHRVSITDLDVYGNVFVGRGNYRTEAPGGPKETPKKTRFNENTYKLGQTPFKVEVKPGMEPVTLDIKK